MVGIGYIADPTPIYMKDCCSINEEFSIDSFIDWGGQNWFLSVTPK